MTSIEIAPGYDRYATVHPDNLAEFAQHLESIGVHLAVDLVLHRRLWAERRLPLGRGNQSQVADTVRKVTGGKALEVAAFNSFAD